MAHFTVTYNTEDEEVFAPKSLQFSCIKELAVGTRYLLVDNKVPPPLLYQILPNSDHYERDYIETMLEIANKVEMGRLFFRRLDLNNCPLLTDSQFEEIMKVEPITLEINNCPLLTSKAFDVINKYGNNLQTLLFGNSSWNIVKTSLEYWRNAETEQLKEWDLSLGLLNTPNLRHLALWSLNFGTESQQNEEDDFLEWLTRRFIGRLEHLDLSNSRSVKSLEFLENAKLEFLRLSIRVPPETIHWNLLAEFKQLRFLDLADCGIDDVNTGVLANIMDNLPELTHLDLTGNELAVSEVRVGTGYFRINGLISREYLPLQWINLHRTNSSHCQVPAYVVVKDGDDAFQNIIREIRYHHGGDVPEETLNALHVISIQRTCTNWFPWKEAIHLMLKEAGPNMNYDSMLDIFHNALWEPHELDKSQVSMIFNWIIKALERNWKFSVEVPKAISVLGNLCQIMDIYDAPLAPILTKALLNAARNAMRKCKTCDADADMKGWMHCLRVIGFQLKDEFNPDALTRLNQEVREIATEIVEMHATEKDVKELFVEVLDKF